MILTCDLDHVCEMPDAGLKRGFAGLPGVFGKENRAEVQAGDAARFADRLELVVGQVAGGVQDCTGVGMSGDERNSFFGNIPEAFHCEMRGIDNDAKVFTAGDKAFAVIRKAGTCVTVATEAEWHTVAEYGWTRPDNSEGAQAQRVKRIEREEVGANAVGTFEVQNTGNTVGDEGCGECRSVGDDLDLASVMELPGDGGLPDGGSKCVTFVQHGRHRHREDRRIEISEIENTPIHWRVDREEAAFEAARFGVGDIYMPIRRCELCHRIDHPAP